MPAKIYNDGDYECIAKLRGMGLDWTDIHEAFPKLTQGSLVSLFGQWKKKQVAAGRTFPDNPRIKKCTSHKTVKQVDLISSSDGSDNEATPPAQAKPAKIKGVFNSQGANEDFLRPTTSESRHKRSASTAFDTSEPADTTSTTNPANVEPATVNLDNDSIRGQSPNITRGGAVNKGEDNPTAEAPREQIVVLTASEYRSLSSTRTDPTRLHIWQTTIRDKDTQIAKLQADLAANSEEIAFLKTWNGKAKTDAEGKGLEDRLNVLQDRLKEKERVIATMEAGFREYGIGNAFGLGGEEEEVGGVGIGCAGDEPHGGEDIVAGHQAEKVEVGDDENMGGVQVQ